MRNRYYFLLFLWPFLIASSCFQIQDYPPEPSIAFENYYSTDTVDKLGNMAYFGKITISFIDGDGDIGLRDGDTIPPYDTASKFYYNLFITRIERKGADTVIKENNSRMPVITPVGQNKTLQGEIDIFISITIPLPDSVQYEVAIADRALHESNQIVTPFYKVK